MKLKDKIKTYSFWVSLASAIILILKLLGNRFNFVVDETMISDLFTALCSILVLLGIIVVPTSLTTVNQDKNKFTLEKDSIKYNSKENTVNENDSFLNFNNNNQPDNFNKEDQTENFISNETTDLHTSNHQNESIIDQENCLNSNTSSLEINDNFNNTTTIDEDENKELQIKENNNTQNQNTSNLISSKSKIEDSITTNPPDTLDFKSLLDLHREKFSNNIEEYIFELQEAIRKTREGV